MKSDLVETLKTNFPKWSSLSRSHLSVCRVVGVTYLPSVFLNSDLWFREQFVRRHEMFLGTALSCSLLIFM